MELSDLGLRITEVPLFSHQVAGLENLRMMMRAIYGVADGMKGRLAVKLA